MTDDPQIGTAYGPEQVLKNAGATIEHYRPNGQKVPETEGFKVYRIGDFLSLDLPDVDYVLDPIIPAKGLVMLCAQRGVGKTHVALGIAYAVAAGGSFLRWTAPKPRKVLIVDGEMPARLLQDRLKSLSAGGSSDAVNLDENLRLLPMDCQAIGTTLNLANSTHQKELDRHLDGVELLVIDNLSTLVNDGRENEAESWDKMQEWMLQLRRRGISVLIIHHAGRNENPRGTSKREDVLDTVIQLKRPPDYNNHQGARFEVHLTKARGVFGEEARPFEAQLETPDGVAVWTNSEVKDVDAELVKDLTGDDHSVREIAEKTGISKSKVSRIQQQLRLDQL